MPRLQNGGFEEVRDQVPTSWRPWERGFVLRPGVGHSGSNAISCSSTEADGEFGASQAITLNQTNPTPLLIQGWSKAENVTGSADSGYSLYADVIYTDGTPSWARNVGFDCGTHDWQQQQFVLVPDKPIRALTLHCLFRGHTGQVWFDDIGLIEMQIPNGAFQFQGVAVNSQGASPRRAGGPPTRHRTQDGLQLSLRDQIITSLQINGHDWKAPSVGGFLARDFAANSDICTFQAGDCRELNLRLRATVRSEPDHLIISGSVSNRTGRDRAITLCFALPVDATGWHWGDDVRAERRINGSGEFCNAVDLRSGANGKMSRYPLAAIWNATAGLALATDLAAPAQCRLVYHAGTRQFFIAYDLALVPETRSFPNSAPFRFVIYRFDPRWGFRAALQKYYEIFPQSFVKRVTREGIWMPFTDVARVPHFEDFGFAFQEGAPNVAFDDQHDIASFVYVEPMSHWLALPRAVPRTYEAALGVLKQDLAGARNAEQKRMAAATFTSGIHDLHGQFALYLVNAPWCDGGVFTLNPDPDLPTTPDEPFTKAMVMNDSIQNAFRNNRSTNQSPRAGLDGVYFDSFEMSASQLNYRRAHFESVATPLVFDPRGRPAQMMIFSTWKFANAMATRLHAEGHLTFANAVLWDFGFPASLLDVLGTEVNWLDHGQYHPDSDAVMNFRRALCDQKPYCLLLNTDYQRFTPDLVTKFFQRCLFYGVWPGFFDQEAASHDPYWTSPKAYFERDRGIFRKYIPLLRALTAAGWQPITRAEAANSEFWLERYGTPAQGPVYLTVFNPTNRDQSSTILLDPELTRTIGSIQIRELVSGVELARSESGWLLQLPAETVAVLELRR